MDTTPFTGADLRAHREAKNLSRKQLAELAGISPYTVRYWERKQIVDVLGWAPRKMAAVLFDDLDTEAFIERQRKGAPGAIHAQDARARVGVLEAPLAEEAARLGLPRSVVRIFERLAKRRIQCGAKTRKGHPCRAKSEPGRRRCRFHGGLSTGPKTAEGKERIAEAQKRRWAEYRSKKADEVVSAAD